MKMTFQLEVRSRFEVLQNQQQLDIHDVNTVMMEVGQETLGLRRRRDEEWISAKMCDMIGKGN